MSRFDDLLEVQEHDNEIDRLALRRRRLPEREQLVDREREADELRARIDELEHSRGEAATEERRQEDNVAAVEERVSQVEADLYSGATSAPKELQAIQADLEQLRRQQSNFEDQQLDAMERREGLDGEISQLDEKLAEVQADADRLREAIAEQEWEIDARVDEERAARREAASRVGEEILDLYERIRPDNRGVGAARLVSGTCQACHLALPAVEVDRIKKQPPDTLVRCEQCGAILVRS